jgi:hypothetical protein
MELKLIPRVNASTPLQLQESAPLSFDMTRTGNLLLEEKLVNLFEAKKMNSLIHTLGA